MVFRFTCVIFLFFRGHFCGFSLFLGQKVTQFVARLGRGAKKCVLLVLKNQWFMKKFNFFQKNACKIKAFVRLYDPFSRHGVQHHTATNENELDL